ncbi:NUC173-domain-containing protein [Patellaria atrata CBS 101060]|uniref:NUC173-domain-containing protein n=1 Tax=Patellaria atrata CBS 101060 TaxID=1346257 RepID=A0A9P4SC59_9PEZI|nr:NUC173-domain-containing protein [Patellaria atrata CBS 101060]
MTANMSLAERLDKIRSSPKQQNQQQTAVVLNAVEDTLRDQKSEPTPTAYFAALLSLLGQYISSEKGIVNKDVLSAVVYLLDLVTPHVPAPLLRSKFSQILASLAPALTHSDADAPLLRSSIGCLESLLAIQDAQSWTLPQTQISPRRAVAGLLAIAVDHRPKVRKRAQEALTKILKTPPPSPSLDHPAADMCAESALRSLSDIAEVASKSRKHGRDTHQNDPGLIHALQLIKTIASASGGWPSKKIDSLCELLLNISRSSNEYLTMTAFEVFEVIFEGIAADEVSHSKLPRMLEVIEMLKPAQTDSQLLPPWIAVLSRGYDVASQIEPDEIFLKLPQLFSMVSSYLSSPSHNIRISASECLISFCANCIPDSVILDPSVYDEKILEKLTKAATDLLSVKYQAAWMEVFNVLAGLFDALRWRSSPLLSDVVKTVGDLRANESFAGKKEADYVLSKAIQNMGADSVLKVLPLNIIDPIPGVPGRVWLLPIMRDAVSNTRLQHFKDELIPFSEAMHQKVLDHGDVEKTMSIKIFETLVHQAWAILPGYCDLPLDLVEAFDQRFAELLSNLLYQQPELRTDLCRALRNLVDSNKAILAIEGEENLLIRSRISEAEAQKNLDHLAAFAGNILAVLFNVYSETLPQYRGTILQCVNAYLSIIPEKELIETFERVISMLSQSLPEAGPQTQAAKQKDSKPATKMPPVSHTLMDLVITMSIYLPRASYTTLFQIASLIINKDDDPQLQKKAYKLIPRLAESETGKVALVQRSAELQILLLESAKKVAAPSRRDRLAAILEVVSTVPKSDLHFIPSVLSEVVFACKEVNEKARAAAFDLLVAMGKKMAEGGLVVHSKIAGMPADAANAEASLAEYLTMVSAGLAGTSPHMVSASITALTRILYEFRQELKEETIVELVQTMDLFLTSPNREIVRSVLGFVKVSVISLPEMLIKPRLQTLIPNLMSWSKEHKAHFRAKVKHILERMIRRFGVEEVEKWTPEQDKKLITNIRKTRERRKRKKDAAADGEDEDDTAPQKERKGKFESEFDEAVYGSDTDDSDTGSESEAEPPRNNGAKKSAPPQAERRNNTFITEDEDEPLDLLSSRALGHISTTKPLKTRIPPPNGKRTKAKTDLDGKLVFREGESDEEMDAGGEPGDGTLEGGVNAYVEAIRGRDAAVRGQRGRLKFKGAGRAGGGAEDMDVDDEGDEAVKVKAQGGARGKARGGKGGSMSQRRGLGMDKTRGGRVVKSPRGKLSYTYWHKHDSAINIPTLNNACHEESHQEKLPSMHHIP